jgi:superfamily I DNA/RNA helicase
MIKWTDEQEKVFNAEGNFKVNAVAGAGKTSTLVEYARRRPRTRFLYLAFNRSVKEEATRKFPKNVKVSTFHGLAYGYIVHRYGYQIGNLTAWKIAKEYGDYLHSDRINANKMAFIVKEALEFWCNTEFEDPEVAFGDFVINAGLDRVAEDQRIDLKGCRKCLLKIIDNMKRGISPITHSFYLKLFSLKAPKLNYDAIFFDEAQDANPAMTEVILTQEHAQKIFVGDPHQQIYGWRHAVNTMETLPYKEYTLTRSFRFHQDIANLAKLILLRKQSATDRKTDTIEITGVGGKPKTGKTAIISRTNAGLLYELIEEIKNTKNNIYVEGGLDSILKSEMGITIMDIYYLKKGDIFMIQSPFVLSFRTFDEFEEFVSGVNFMKQAEFFIKTIKQFGQKLPDYIEELKRREITDKTFTDKVFTTTHKAKGLEFDRVEMCDDFPDLSKLEEVAWEARRDGNIKMLHALKEEFNILYVAVTRAINELTPAGDLFISYESLKEANREHGAEN